MKYFIVKQQCDYADEFYTNGLQLFEAESRQKLIKDLVPEDIKFPTEKWFGTNEAIEFYTKEDYLNSLKITEITEEEYKITQKVVGIIFGTFFNLES